MKTKKALVLFSGGLDSMLAVRVLEDQGFLVTGVCFESNFYNADKAKEVAAQIELELIIIDISKEILDLVKNPPHGLGKNMNPCIDCHGLMIKRVGDIMDEIGAEVVATGEVLGQRPFSQNKQALGVVKNISGVDVLRPLSAQLLDETDLEKNGIVSREKLFSIQGRRREGQKELIEKYKIKEYPSPAGGCLLTDPEFSKRLKQMVEYWPNCKPEDVGLLRHGRVFWAKIEDKNVLLVIGRHREDNGNLEKVAKNGDIMVELKQDKGPSALVRRIKILDSEFRNDFKVDVPSTLNFDLESKMNKEEFIKVVTKMTGYYAPKLRGKEVKFVIKNIK